ncbi:MAG: PDZ domain-containing protein [Verrucomicrobiota bacterium]
MKSGLILLFVLSFCIGPLTGADDIRSKVKGAGSATFRGLEIDPDSNVFGVPFGASEDDFIKARGKPDGYVRLSDKAAALIYGRSMAFVFESGNLAGVRITDQLLDWKLANKFRSWNSLLQPDWRLNNGIFTGMNRKEVKRILGDKLQTGEFDDNFYKTAEARVELDFSHYINEGEGEEAHRLTGIYVWHGDPPEDSFRIPGFPDGVKLDAAGDGLSFGGIGAILRINRDSGELEVVKVVPGSPAARAALESGQVIRSIDGASTKGKELSETTAAVRGAPATTVKLEVYDPKEDKSRVVELTRAMITLDGEDWPGGRSLAITTAQMLRLESTSGARAVVQFIGFANTDRLSREDGQETATYRWRLKTSPSGPVETGTNTTINRYKMKLTGPNRYEVTPITSREEAMIKVGEFSVPWSYGHTNKGYIYALPSHIKASVQELKEFEKGP